MAKEKPWLDYNGETTAQLLACKKTHRIDSLLCAFEWGIQGKKKQTPEERLVLSVMALDREVHNGGFDQFFRNSSKRYAPMIVKSLETIGSARTASLAARAIDALKLERVTRKALDDVMAKRSPARDKKLDQLDQEYYAFYENADKLFAYVEKNADHITCDRIPAPKIEDEPTPISDVAFELEFDDKPPETLPASVTLARRIVAKEKMNVTEEEVLAGARLYFFDKLATEERWDEGEGLAQAVIDSAGNEASVQVKRWVTGLIGAKRKEDADRWATVFLHYLQSREQEPSQDDILFWTNFVKENARTLPNAFAFSRKAFARGKRKN